jgi:hypothetical protein
VARQIADASCGGGGADPSSSSDGTAPQDPQHGKPTEPGSDTRSRSNPPEEGGKKKPLSTLVLPAYAAVPAQAVPKGATESLTSKLEALIGTTRIRAAIRQKH